MKHKILLFSLVLLLFGCGKKYEKPETPEACEALRTRNTEIPVDSMFTSNAVKSVFDVFGNISFGKLVEDYKSVEIDTTSEATKFRQWKEGVTSISDNHSEGYLPGLTLYFAIVLVVFAIILIIKFIRVFIRKK